MGIGFLDWASSFCGGLTPPFGNPADAGSSLLPRFSSSKGLGRLSGAIADLRFTFPLTFYLKGSTLT